MRRQASLVPVKGSKPLLLRASSGEEARSEWRRLAPGSAKAWDFCLWSKDVRIVFKRQAGTRCKLAWIDPKEPDAVRTIELPVVN